MTVLVDPALVERGLEILDGVSEHDDLAARAGALDDRDVLAVESVIRFTLQVGHLNFSFAPCEPVEDEDCSVADTVLDAAELLAHRSTSSSVSLVVNLFDLLLAEGEDDLVGMYGADIVASFAPHTAPELLQFVRQSHATFSVKAILIDGINSMGKDNLALQQRLQTAVLETFQNVKSNPPDINAYLISLAVDWQITSLAEVIERAFSEDRVDCGICGNWEAVRQKLNVAGLGLPMPQRPIDSMRSFRQKLGVGLFSDKPLWDLYGQRDEAAIDAYIANVTNAFHQSSFAPTNSAELRPGFVRDFLRMSIHTLRTHVETMKVEQAKYMLLTVYPAHVSMQASDANAAVDVLVAFWKYCDQVHRVEHAARIATMISSIRQAFHRSLSNPENFRPAKSLVMRGRQAGIDIENPQALDAWIASQNRWSSSRIDPSSIQIVRSHVHVQNDSTTGDGHARRDQPSVPPQSLKERKKLLKRLKRK